MRRNLMILLYSTCFCTRCNLFTMQKGGDSGFQDKSQFAMREDCNHSKIVNYN